MRYAARNLPDVNGLGKGAWYDHDAAERAIVFFKLFLTLGKERRNESFVPDDWQETIIRTLMGWKREDGTRWFREVSLWLPRKNGKSTLAAGLTLLLLYADGIYEPEGYLCANSREQTRAVFDECVRMVSEDAELEKRSQIADSTARTLSIIVPETMGSVKGLSAEARTKDGLNPTFVVFDEIHAMKGQAFDLVAKMTSGSGARKSPMFIYISTAGNEMTTVGFARWQMDDRILAGHSGIEDRLIIKFAASEQDDWTDEATWYKANPMLGRSLSIQDMRSRFAEALEDMTKEAEFKQYALNIWVSPFTGYIDGGKWDRCATIEGEPAPTLEAIAEMDTWIGCDLSATTDLTALVLIGRKDVAAGETGSGEQEAGSGERGTGEAATSGGVDAAAYFQYSPSPTARYFILPHFFLPRDGVEQKETRDGMPYRKLAKRGLMTLTEGSVVDYNHVAEFLLTTWMPRLKKFHEFCYDPFSAEMFRQTLEAAGVPCVRVAQITREVSPPTAELVKLVAARRLAHGGNELMRWMIRNVRVEKDRNDNPRLSKRGSVKRIDGIAATITGLARASVADLTPSWYDRPDAKAPTIRIG